MNPDRLINKHVYLQSCLIICSMKVESAAKRAFLHEGLSVCATHTACCWVRSRASCSEVWLSVTSWADGGSDGDLGVFTPFSWELLPTCKTSSQWKNENPMLIRCSRAKEKTKLLSLRNDYRSQSQLAQCQPGSAQGPPTTLNWIVAREDGATTQNSLFFLRLRCWIG